MAAEARTEGSKTFIDRVEDLLWPLTIVLVLIAPSQFSYALDPKDGPFILYADLFAAALFGLWALVVLIGRRWKKIAYPPAAIWALLAVAAISALGATSLSSAVVEIAQLGLYFVAVYALFANIVRGQHRLVLIAKIVAIGTTVAIGFALYQYFTVDDPMDVRGTFGNRNVYSAYLVMVLPLLYGMAIWTRDTTHRAWFFVVVALGAMTMLAGLQFWCLMLVLLVLSALKSLRWLGYFVLGAAIIITLFVGVLHTNRDAVFAEVTDPIERGETFKLGPGHDPEHVVKMRWLEWHPALVMTAENFPTGVGVGNYQRHIGESSYWGMVPRATKIEPDTNNLYLVIAASMGFVGLVALLAWLGHHWRLAESNWTEAKDAWSMGVCWGLLGSVYGIVLVNIFSSLFVRGTSLVWALIFAMIASVSIHGFGGNDVSSVENASKHRSRED
ncbi:MAG: O-antigen ligase family protein [Armatimonadota bacterium]